MTYLLNSVSLSTYGIIAGHSGGSNISLSGCFNLPERTGKTHYSWGDENSIEPYTATADLMFAGRDIVFTGAIFGTNTVINNYLKTLYDAINAFNTTVIFSTPYGDFTVYVKSVIPEYTNGGAKIQMIFREPVVTLTGTLPAVGDNAYTIDAIPFSSFGLYLSKAEALHDLPELKEQFFTKYGSEGYQIVKRKNKTLEFNGFIIGTSLSDFQDKVKALYKLFSSAGTRNVKINGQINIDCFAVNGFTVENVCFYGQVIANFKAYLLCYNVNYINELSDESGDLITTEESVQILI